VRAAYLATGKEPLAQQRMDRFQIGFRGDNGPADCAYTIPPPGGCRDGLAIQNRANENQGAESTLSLLMGDARNDESGNWLGEQFLMKILD